MNGMKRLVFQVVMAGLWAVCGLARPPLALPNAVQRPGAAGDTRHMDFQDFMYKTGEILIHVSRGRGTYKTSGSTESSYVVEKVKAVHGDLTGDGKEEAAVILYFTGGGSGAFSKGFLFTLREKQLLLLALAEPLGGDLPAPHR